MTVIEKAHIQLAFQILSVTQLEVPLPSTRIPKPGEEGNPEPTFPTLPIVNTRGKIGRHHLKFVSWEDYPQYSPSRDEDLTQGGHVYHDNGHSDWGRVDSDDRDHYGQGYGEGGSDKSSK